MARYSVHFINREKQIVRLATLDCESDQEASRKAAALVDNNIIELWRDNRRLGRFNPNAPRTVASASAQKRKIEALIDKGLALHRAGELSEAAKQYSNVLRADNDNAQAMTLLGTLQAQRGNLDKAVALLNRSLEIDPSQHFAFNSLGNALNSMKRHDEALAAFDKSLALKPDQAATYSNGGNALRGLKRNKEALAAYRRANKIDPDYAEAYGNRGDLLRELKRYDDAVASYDRAVALRPESTRDWFARAVALQEAGRPKQAVDSYDRAIALKPGMAEAWNNRGNALATLERYDEAIGCYREAVKRKSAYQAAYNNWGNALKELGRLDEAANCYRQAIARKRDYADAHGSLGFVLDRLGRHADALASLDQAIAFAPDNAEFHRHRGNVMRRSLKRPHDAIASYERAIALRPDFVDALFERGIALEAVENPAGALSSYDQALALKPDFAEVHNNRGNVLAKLQRHEEALASYDAAVRTRPDYAQAHCNQGNVWKATRNFPNALASYNRAIAAKPDHAAAHLGRGEALHRLGRFDAAVESYDRAIDLSPNDAVAHFRKSNSLKGLKRFDEALHSIDTALELDPGMQYAVGQRYLLKLHMCDWAGLDAAGRAVLDAIERGVPSCVPLPVIGTPPEQRKWAEAYVQDKYPAQTLPASAESPPADRAAKERIRIAYLSADFHAHATSCLMAGVWEQHDRSRFEVYAISFGRADGSPMRTRVESAFEHFVDVCDMADMDVASLLRAHRIDIAVDLKGFTKDARTGILAFRPAPIQVNYLGYPGTMGAAYVDYLIADKILVPQGEQPSYSESVVYLPDTYQCNDSKRKLVDASPRRFEAGLPETGFVFCSFNNNYKITPDIFDIWMRLLKATEGSVLWLLESNPQAARNLRREAEARGVAGERLIFAPLAPYDEHLARIPLADLVLDTLPYGAHTTASDALWTGVPVLTCVGEAFAGRVAASLLNAVGLPDMVTRSLEEYEARALSVAHEPSVLDDLKARLASNRATQPLFDTVRFTRHLEAAYTTMVERHRAGEPPAGFAVASRATDVDKTECS